jgi:hypothetical protein
MAIKFLNDQLFPTDIFLVDVSAGRVGINTLLPRTALEVVGTLRVWSGANTHTYVETSSGSNLGSIQGKKNSDNAVRSLALNPLGGNVGINLGAGIIPSEALQVQGSARIQADSNNYVQVSVSGTGDTTIAPTGNGVIAPDLTLSAGSAYIKVDAQTNNVGIGTTSPSRQLTLGGAAPVLSLHSTSTTGESSIYFGDTADDNEGRIVYSNSQDNMQIWTAAAERIRVTSAGDTGIGVTSPRAKLDVNGGVKVGNDVDGAGSNKVGTLRYRYVPGSPKNFSYVDMCMQTGTNSYAWVNIVQNVWN